ncbi:MAG: hypothetical protein J5659_00170 [Clostridia bacterium]|nr:hypothetical protein [Clostridia bacterium]
MIQNIKVDIVYFATPTDFEFEFNLGGCCHMRLLNGKAKDKKEFVNSLARAVSRSRIILCVGPIFGEDGLISITSTAISRPLKAVDNTAYGIASDSEIKIIDGAVPLVTPEGYFGGCIIESGPQTIVLLTENKTVRKSIMKNLIHPYIEETSLLQSTGSIKASGIEGIARAAAKETPTDSELPEAVDALSDDNGQDDEGEALPENTKTGIQDEKTDNGKPGSLDNMVKESQSDVSEELTNRQAEDMSDEIEHNIEFDFSTEDSYGNVDYDNVENELDNTVYEDDDEFVAEDNSYSDGRSKGISISILIITLILLFAVLGLCYFLIYVPMKNGISTTDYIKRLFGVISPVAFL